MATLEELETGLVNAHKAGDSNAANVFAKEIKKIRSSQPGQDFNPLGDRNAFQTFLLGMGKSLADTGHGIGQLIGTVSPEEVEQHQAVSAPIMDTGAGLAGNIGGHALQFAAPGGLLSATGKAATSLGAVNAGTNLGKLAKLASGTNSIKNAATVGALYGGLQPGDKVENMMLGGIGGAGGQGLSKFASAAIAPKVSGAVRGLLGEGVELTPGQIAGGAAQRMEDALTSAPLIGDVIIGAKKRAIETFNRATWNKVLSPIGQKLPKNMQGGRQAFDYTDGAISDAYDDLLPKLKGRIDLDLENEIFKISEMVETLPEERVKQFHKIMADKFYKNFTPMENTFDLVTPPTSGLLGNTPGTGLTVPGKSLARPNDFIDGIAEEGVKTTGSRIGGLASGNSIKKVESELGRIARNYRSSSDADQRLLGDALQEVQASVRKMLIRENPKHVDELRNIDKAYMLMLRPEAASKSLGAQDGIFTGAQLLNAVKSTDKSFSKRQFAKGHAPMQNLAESAKDILGQKVPDSGTPFRSATLLTGGAGAAGALVDPTLGLLALPASAYTKTGQKILRGLLTQRPRGAEALAKDIEKLSPLLTATGVGGLLASP